MGLYAFGLVGVIAALAASGVVGFAKGSASRNGEIADLRAAITVSKELAKAADERAKSAAAKVVTVYRDRIKTIRERGITETKLVEVVKREIDPNCSMPASFRRLWDGSDNQSAANSAGTDGPPVALADVATVTAEAKRRFEENAARLAALQQLITEVQAGNNHKPD